MRGQRERSGRGQRERSGRGQRERSGRGQQEVRQRSAQGQREVRALTAGLAAVGFVSAVSQLVFEQLPLHVEGFPALLAGELRLRAVRLLVLLQVAEVAEACETEAEVSMSLSLCVSVCDGAHLVRRCHTGAAALPSGR